MKRNRKYSSMQYKFNTSPVSVYYFLNVVLLHKRKVHGSISSINEYSESLFIMNFDYSRHSEMFVKDIDVCSEAQIQIN